MTSLKKRVSRAVLATNVAIGTFATSASAQFTQGNEKLSDIGNNADSEIGAFGQLFFTGLQLFSVVIIASSIMKLKFAMDNDNGQNKKGPPLWGIVFGFVLLVFPFFIGAGISSFFGSNATQSTTITASDF